MTITIYPVSAAPITHIVQSEVVSYTGSLSLNSSSTFDSSNNRGNSSNPIGWPPVRSVISAGDKIFTNQPGRAPIYIDTTTSVHNSVTATSRRATNLSNKLQPSRLFSLIINLWSLSCLTRAEEAFAVSVAHGVQEDFAHSSTPFDAPMFPAIASQPIVRAVDSSPSQELLYTIRITSTTTSTIRDLPKPSSDSFADPLNLSWKDCIYAPWRHSILNATIVSTVTVPNIHVATKPNFELLTSTSLTSDSIKYNSTFISTTHLTTTMTETIKSIETDSRTVSETKPVFSGPQMVNPLNASTKLLDGIGTFINFIIVASLTLVMMSII